jgi:hypothetical protein
VEKRKWGSGHGAKIEIVAGGSYVTWA